MSRMFTVARREYVERVRSKAFLISTFLGPVLMAGLMIGPGLLMARQSGKPIRVAIVDASGTLAAPIERALQQPVMREDARRDNNQRTGFVVVPLGAGDTEAARQKARQEVIEGRLDGFLYLPPDALATSKAEYYGRNTGSVMDVRILDNTVEDALIGVRLGEAGLDPGRVKALTRKLDLRTVRLTAAGEREDRGATFFLAFLFLMMLYTTVAMWGAAIMNGVIEEKSNRVVEVIVSSLPTTSLFGGKLLGVGAAGLTQFLVWTVTLGAVSGYSAAMGGALRMPEMSPVLLGAFVGFFVLGYFLYGSLYAAVGAAVNTPQEAQALAFPVMMPLIMCVVFAGAVLRSPDSTFSVVLSLIPFFTPLLMLLRMATVMPPFWEIVLSVALTLATIAVVTWGAARVYRVGILMHGKRPTFPEILRWARIG